MAIATHRYQIRAMTVEDIPEVVAIERQSFEATWPRTAYRRELENNKLARYIVAEECGDDADLAPPPPPPLRPRWQLWLRRLFDGPEVVSPPPPPRRRVVGYLGLWFQIGEGHIVAVATHPDHRRRGIGEMLVAEALRLSEGHGEDCVTLEVRLSNTSAQDLYQKYGFERVGVRRRYYTDNNEDGVIMTTPHFDDPDFRQRLVRLTAERERER